MNIINLKRKMTQYYLDWGTTLALFKEIQAFSWLNFVIGADLLWLVSSRIQQFNKYRMARTTSAQSVQAQNSTRKSTPHLPLAHVSNPIFETIHVSPLIITVKKNKIVSLFFNVGLNIFINSSSSKFTPTSLQLYCNIYSF